MAADESFLELDELKSSTISAFIKVQALVRGFMVRRVLCDIRREYETIVKDIDSDMDVYWPERVSFPSLKKRNKRHCGSNPVNKSRKLCGEEKETNLPSESHQQSNHQCRTRQCGLSHRNVSSPQLIVEVDVNEREIGEGKIVSSSLVSPSNHHNIDFDQCENCHTQMKDEPTDNRSRKIDASGGDIFSGDHMKHGPLVINEIPDDGQDESTIELEKEVDPRLGLNVEVTGRNDTLSTVSEHSEQIHNDARSERTDSNYDDNVNVVYSSSILTDVRADSPAALEVKGNALKPEVHTNVEDSGSTDCDHKLTKTNSCTSENEVFATNETETVESESEQVSAVKDPTSLKDIEMSKLSNDGSSLPIIPEYEQAVNSERESNAEIMQQNVTFDGDINRGDINTSPFPDLPSDKESLLEMKKTMTMELLWIQQAINSRKHYLRLKQQLVS